MMDKLLYIILFAVIPSLGFSQETERTTQHEIGMNATYFFRQFLGSGSSPLLESPYLLTYRAYFSTWTLRGGLGLALNRDKASEEGFEDSQTVVDYAVDARLGMEWNKAFGKKWKGTFGGDLIVQQDVSKNITDSGFDKVVVTSKEQGLGVGPVLGLHFLITPNLSLYTEGTFYVLVSKTENKTEYENLPQFDDQTLVNNRLELATTLPASIFLLYRF